MARGATLVLTVLAAVVLAAGSVATVQLLFTEGEGSGFGYALTWPLTWLLYGLLAALALWAAGRSADGLLWLGAVLAADLLVWLIGLPLLAVLLGALPLPTMHVGAFIASLTIIVFDGCALYIAGRFLFRGSHGAILGP